MPIKVIIVDDSAVTRQWLSSMLCRLSSQIEVIATAPDPFSARNKIVNMEPDVLLLDMEMPKMNGMVFLKKIMKHFPLPVIMMSAFTPKGSRLAIEALNAGAVDVFFKEREGQAPEDMMKELVQCIEKVVTKKRRRQPSSATPKPTTHREGTSPQQVIAIGSSTGGTEALKEIFERLPAQTPPIVIVQHMPESFTSSFAERLNHISKIEVREAQNGDLLYSNLALIAPGNRHMRLKRRGSQIVIELIDSAPVSRHRPSVDVLFDSVAKVVKDHATGVMLTGMGSDGAMGMLNMKRAGAINIAQDEKSCVVFGMPKEAIEHGGVHHVCPLHSIPSKMLSVSQPSVRRAYESS